MDLRIREWNESYERRENHLFYSKEETVKFLNRFVRKRYGLDRFENREGFSARADSALDVGCGIGRQTILLAEFGFDAVGVDISSEAIAVARQHALTQTNLPFGRRVGFSVLESTQLPFADGAFDVVVCDSVLDSMRFETACELMKEIERTVIAYAFITLISKRCHATGKAEEVVVTTPHEFSTVQSYFDVDKLEELRSVTALKRVWMNEVVELDGSGNVVNSRYHVVLRKP